MTKGVHAKLVAMADVFEDRLKSYKTLITTARGVKEKVDVPDDRKFIGFDAYKHAMDCLKPGDVAIFTTPLAFRWVHFTYAIEKGLNVFMEKPLSADGAASRRMLKLAEAGGGKKPESRRRTDVAPRPPRSRNCTSASRTVRSATSSSCAATAWPGPSARSVAPKPEQHQRTGIADPAVPQLPLGQRRVLQRFQHPHHRPPLLDEKRVAGQGAGRGRAALQVHRRRPAVRRPELRFVWDRIHFPRRHQVVL